MPDFSHRASPARNPELMDGPCSYEDLCACLRDISQVNSLSLGFAPTFHWLNHVYRSIPLQAKPVHLVDVGCGDGEMLRRISQWARDRSFPMILTGIDLNPGAIRAARATTKPDTVTFLEGNAFDFHPAGGIDLVVSSLLTHHLEDGEVIDFLAWMESTARLGWFINDLHRQPVPYRLFRLAAFFMPWHRFVKHDGAVSILRSFRKQDWAGLLRKAGIGGGVNVREHWPGRLCVERLK